MEKKKSKLKIILLTTLIITFIVCSLLLYSRYIGTSGIFINEYKIENKNLIDDFYGLKIVHISDIHYGRTIHKKELDNIVKKINETKPDIVVLTGDLIDKDTKLDEKMINDITNSLKKIDVNIEKYAIKGNHDYKFSEWDILIENSGFKNLNDTYDLIYTKSTNYILIEGLSTNVYGEKTIEEKITDINNETTKITEDNKPNYTILLMHEPDFIDKIDYSNYNLVLAGHSHNGQVRLPFIGAIVKPNYAQKYYDSYYKLKTTDLYISSGIGTSEINFRLFNHPSFNLYRLTNS